MNKVCVEHSLPVYCTLVSIRERERERERESVIVCVLYYRVMMIGRMNHQECGCYALALNMNWVSLNSVFLRNIKKYFR